MIRYSSFLLLGFLALSCSSKDEGDGGPNGNNPGGNETPDIDLPGGGGTIPPGSDTPGLTDVPPEAVETLRKSSCAGWSAEGELVPAVLELVVDVSSSMKSQAPGTKKSKWEATREALLEAIVGVDGPGLPGSTGVGLLFYPNKAEAVINARPGDINGCVQTSALVPIETLGPKGATHRDRIAQAISSVQLNTSTPTHDAFRYALNTGLLPTKVPGSKYMLLITDGEPTLSLGCVNTSGSLQGVDPRPIVEEVRTAAQKYAKTFLIGSPGSEKNRKWMSEAARIGGTAPAGCSDDGPNYCHMDLTQSADFSTALRKGLEDVAGQIASCTYELPEPPPGKTLDPSHINVIYTPGSGKGSRLVGRSSDANCKEGWRLDGSEVTICPDTCASIQGDAGSTVELLFGCAAVDAPVK